MQSLRDGKRRPAGGAEGVLTKEFGTGHLAAAGATVEGKVRTGGAHQRCLSRRGAGGRQEFFTSWKAEMVSGF